MITQYKDKTNKVQTFKTKTHKEGIFIVLPNGETSASFKTEKEYHNEIREKLASSGFEVLNVK